MNAEGWDTAADAQKAKGSAISNYQQQKRITSTRSSAAAAGREKMKTTKHWSSKAKSIIRCAHSFYFPVSCCCPSSLGQQTHLFYPFLFVELPCFSCHQNSLLASQPPPAATGP
jgi:hypothetical protein